MELALVLLPLLLLLLGIVEFSRIFYMRMRLQQAAHQTARQIALHYDDPGLLDLGGLIDETLDNTLGNVVDIDDLTTQSITSCVAGAAGPQDAVVILGTSVSTALPIDPIPIAGSATMPCEG